MDYRDNGERFGRYCIKGGKAYGKVNKGDVEALNKINDFEWLREQFVVSMKKRITDNYDYFMFCILVPY